MDINSIFQKIKLNNLIPSKIGNISFSKDITKSRILLNVITNRKTMFDNDIPLFWKRYWSLGKNRINLTQDVESREQILKVLPLAIVTRLFQNKDIAFPPDTENEIILFVTIHGLNSFYIVSIMDRSEITSYDLELLTLSFNNSYTFSIRIMDDDKEVHNRKFQLRVNSWNDVAHN